MKWIAIILTALISVMAIYTVAYPSVTLRYRLTVEAELDGQPKVGSGVIEVWYAANPKILGASASTVSAVQGEAVVIDLGDRDALFVLLTHGKDARSGAEDIIPNLFGVVKGGFGPEHFDQIRGVKGRRDIPLELLPLMVRLTNTDDPKSAELFDPSRSDSANRGLKLKKAEVEIVSHGIWPLSAIGITGVPVTRGIQRKLPWLVGFRGYSGGQPDPIWSQPERNLTGADFVQGASS